MTEVLRIRLRWIAGVSGAVVLIILLWQNRESVSVTLFFWDLVVPKLLLLLVSLLVGVLLGFLIAQRLNR